MKKEIAAGNIWFGKNGRNVPRVKKFLSDAKIGLTPETIWTADDVGTSDSAKKQLLELFPNKENVFDTPKPEGLLKRIIEIASNEGDFILDCYLGSGTTVAVAHKMRRRYIGIESGDQMSQLVVSRMNLIVSGEQTGVSKSVNWGGGGSFSLLKFNRTGGGTIVQSYSKQFNYAHMGKPEQLRLALEKRRKGKPVRAVINKKSVKCRYKKRSVDG